MTRDSAHTTTTMPGHRQFAPYIDDQTWMLLTEFVDPAPHLQTSRLRVGRPGAVAVPGQADEDPWVEIDREELVAGRVTLDGQGAVDVRRLVVTSDAGMGKTTAVAWFAYRFGRPDVPQLAFNVPIRELRGATAGVNGRLLGYLAEQLYQAANDEGCSESVASKIIETYRQRPDRLVLMFDGLDQAGEGLHGLKAILASPLWEACRFIVAGRPYALQRNWSQLFADRPWRFVKLEEFEPEQQKRYLGETNAGESRYDLIPEEARPILSVPRVLCYLRKLPDEEYSEIRTAADVYYRAIRVLLKEGMAMSDEARLLGWESETPPEGTHEQNISEGFRLLGCIAYEMTSQTILTEAADGTQHRGPNFDRIERRKFPKFKTALRERYTSLAKGGLPQDLQALAALNDILEHGVFDTDLHGLQEIQFRNRSLQEFLCAYYLAQLATPDDAQRLGEWIYLPDRPRTEAYYYVWQFLCEMPYEALDDECWLTAIGPLYQPAVAKNPDVADLEKVEWHAPRSTEMIFRSWPRLDAYCEQQVPQALDLRERWWGEFQQILDGKQGARRRKLAREFQQSFLRLPKGSYRMGSPPHKQGMPPEARDYWRRWLAAAPEDDAETYVEELLKGYSWPGKVGQRRREEQKKLLLEAIGDGQNGVQRIADAWYPADETPEKPDQEIAAFELGRSPVLTTWYRLFAPAHCRGDSMFAEDYERWSGDDRPAIYVSWFDAWTFCLWARWDGLSCRLPWENEWEYAAKFRTPWDQNYWWGDDFNADCCNAQNDVGTTHPSPAHAGPQTKAIDSEGIGLMDLLGNVWEWCQDQYRGASVRTAADQPGTAHSSRVLRGGAFLNDANDCRSAFRFDDRPAFTGSYGVFRVARA